MRHAYANSHRRADARSGRDDAPRPLVSWRDREGEAESLQAWFRVALATRALARALVAGALALGAARCSRGCGGGTPPGRRRTAGTFRMKVVHASFPRAQAIARPDAARARGPQHRHADGAERRRHARLLRLHLQLSRTGRPKRPIWAIERGPGRDRHAARAEPGSQPARRRADRLRQHLGARPARARHDAHVRLEGGAGQGRAYTVHFSVAAGLAGQGQGASAPPAARCRASSPSTSPQRPRRRT